MIIYTNTTSKKSKKQKLKQKINWQKQQAKYQINSKKYTFQPYSPPNNTPLRPGALDYQNNISHNSNHNPTIHSCSKPQQKIYTGNSIIGIATMHKSNLVPVFNNEQAIDIAKMRRG
jgi:hypothetical protein